MRMTATIRPTTTRARQRGERVPNSVSVAFALRGGDGQSALFVEVLDLVGPGASARPDTRWRYRPALNHQRPFASPTKARRHRPRVLRLHPRQVRYRVGLPCHPFPPRFRSMSTRVRYYSHRVMVNRIATTKRAAIAHPNVIQFWGTRYCRTNAAAAKAVAAIGANTAIASPMSITGPIPGVPRMSSGERRSKRNRSQITAHTARQTIEAVRSHDLAIS
jgi:hypothetical protein